MKVVHLYSDVEGRSCFREIEVPVEADAAGGSFQLPGVLGVELRTYRTDAHTHFRPTARRKLVIALSGATEINCGHNDVRVFGPGDLLLVDDRTGRGHESREITGPRQQLWIYLDERLRINDAGIGAK